MATAVQGSALDQIDHVVQASKDAIKTIRHKVEDVQDLRHEFVHQVRREPIKAVAIALGAGALLGALTAFACTAAMACSRQTSAPAK